jgi:hypothetical protein
MAMNSQLENSSTIENMGSVERATRTLLGLGMVIAVLETPILSEVAIATLSLLSIYIMFTATTGWDPVYALLRKPQRQLSPMPPTATTHSRDVTSHGEHDFEKAA